MCAIILKLIYRTKECGNQRWHYKRVCWLCSRVSKPVEKVKTIWEVTANFNDKDQRKVRPTCFKWSLFRTCPVKLSKTTQMHAKKSSNFKVMRRHLRCCWKWYLQHLYKFRKYAWEIWSLVNWIKNLIWRKWIKFVWGLYFS